MLLSNRDGNSLIMFDFRADNDTISALINYQCIVYGACLLCSQISVIIHTINTFNTAQSIKTKMATWKQRFNLNSGRIRSQNCRHQNYMVVTLCAVSIWAHVTWDTKYWKLKWIHKYFQILGHCPVYVSHKCISWNKDVDLISWYIEIHGW